MVHGLLWLFTRSAELHGDWNEFSITSDSIISFSKVFFLDGKFFLLLDGVYNSFRWECDTLLSTSVDKRCDGS